MGCRIFKISQSLVLAIPVCLITICAEQDIRHPVGRPSHLFTDDFQVNSGIAFDNQFITDKAKEAFLEHTKRCDPPLEESELNTIWASAVRFYKKTVMTQPGYIPPDEYNAEFDSLKPDDYSDIGEARVLVKEYAGELLYTDATEFLSYDGICWRENRQKAVGTVEEFLDMQLVDARSQYSAAMQALIDGGIPEQVVRAGGKALEKMITPDLDDAYKDYLAAKAYYAFVMKYRNYKNIVNTQSAAKPMVATDINLFDAQENYLNTPEATYDLKKGLEGVRAHNSADLLTKITNASPGEEGKPERENGTADRLHSDTHWTPRTAP